MNRKLIGAGLIAILAATALSTALAADTPSKDTAKAEERMREEKRRDEQNARDYANRVKVARFDSIWRAPKHEDIDVFQEEENPSKHTKAIALLTFDCAVADETQAVAGFIEKAKDLGADAVVVIRLVVDASHPTIFAPGDKRVFRANAVIYRAPQ